LIADSFGAHPVINIKIIKKLSNLLLSIIISPY
jgi:hypothetical protein